MPPSSDKSKGGIATASRQRMSPRIKRTPAKFRGSADDASAGGRMVGKRQRQEHDHDDDDYDSSDNGISDDAAAAGSRGVRPIKRTPAQVRGSAFSGAGDRRRMSPKNKKSKGNIDAASTGGRMVGKRQKQHHIKSRSSTHDDDDYDSSDNGISDDAAAAGGRGSRHDYQRRTKFGGQQQRQQQRGEGGHGVSGHGRSNKNRGNSTARKHSLPPPVSYSQRHGASRKKMRRSQLGNDKVEAGYSDSEDVDNKHEMDKDYIPVTNAATKNKIDDQDSSVQMTLNSRTM